MSINVTYAIAAVLVVAIITGGAVYSCSNVNKRYYELANQCISSGGTFVPAPGQNGHDAICLRGAGK